MARSWQPNPEREETHLYRYVRDETIVLGEVQRSGHLWMAYRLDRSPGKLLGVTHSLMRAKQHVEAEFEND